MTEPVKVLAGPILRRTEPGRVCIWIATAAAVEVVGEIFLADDRVNFAMGLKKVPTPAIGRGTAQSIRLGERLHVTLVIVGPDKRRGQHAFPVNKTLAYDLALGPQGGAASTRVGLETLFPMRKENGQDTGIAYAPHTLPTFVVRMSLPVDFFHGSCRKAHGDSPDALAAIDRPLRKAVPFPTTGSRPYDSSNAHLRPGSLLLTGDQIYADDVSDALIDGIAELAKRLMGYDERVQMPNGRTSMNVSELRCGQRGAALARVFEKPLFTSGEKRNHLIAFGDFAAMYLLVWNPDNWGENAIAKQMTCSSGSSGGSVNETFAEFTRQRGILQKFKSTLARVRRVLANIPTYMIFDDHEITDDWNITRDWKQTVESTPLGRRVIANGLAAYWAFQGWGNEPNSYPTNFIAGITEGLRSDSESRDAMEKSVLEFNNWGFTAPGNPTMLFFDERTQRMFDTDKGACRRMSPEALAVALANVQQGQLLVLIAPGPVFGPPLIDSLQASASQKGYINLLEKDFESWHGNLRGFVGVLEAVSVVNPSACLLLSGDVHFAYVAVADYLAREGRSGAGRRPHSFVQFTSSALKNPSAQNFRGMLAGNPDPRMAGPFSGGSISLGYRDSETDKASEYLLSAGDWSLFEQASTGVPSVRFRFLDPGPKPGWDMLWWHVPVKPKEELLTPYANVGRVQIDKNLTVTLLLYVCRASVDDVQEVSFSLEMGRT